MISNNLVQNIENIKNELGHENFVVVKNFYLGGNIPLDAAAIYVEGLINKDIIDRDVLRPLMFNIQEDLNGKMNLPEYLSRRYISMSNTRVETEMNNIVSYLKRGKTAIVINGVCETIIIDTTGGTYRNIGEPENETSVKGRRDSFVENMDTNISITRRTMKDSKLSIDMFTLGRRSQTDVALLYLEDVVDKTILEELKSRISLVDIDGPFSPGMLEQFISDYPYTPFPQSYATERIDVAQADLREGKILLFVDGHALAMILPVIFVQFFQTVEDYNERTLVGSFTRLLRYFAAFMVVSTSAIYLTLLKYNTELIPIKFITPIVQSRIGIALTPFLEILAMELVVELLREGGLRLPSKIAQTLSLVGGIIIGDTAIKSRIVSPTTLLIVGITVVATFLIPNYDMSIAIRLLRFPMLIMANIMGIFGVALGWFFILVHLSSLENLGVPYFEFKSGDMKDTFIRGALWKMNKRPEVIPTNNTTRQTDFRKKFRRREDE